MDKSLSHVVFAALAAGAVFVAAAYLGLGFFFLFLPTLPLLMLGMGKNPRLALQAALLSALIITLALGLEAGAMFALLFGLPSWLICRFARAYYENAAGRAWFPMGLIVLYLVLYACAGLGLTTFYFGGEEGGLAAAMASNINQAFTQLDADYRDMFEQAAERMSFLIIAMMIWMWALTLYFHLWFANRLLAARQRAQRPSVGVEVFAMPGWVFSLLAIAALASLIASPSTRLAGSASLIALMLPYFLLGTALMHGMCKDWPSRRFFLFFVYFMVATLFWPALILSAVGFIYHLKTVNKRLPAA